jgi:hypothetical protein
MPAEASGEQPNHDVTAEPVRSLGDACRLLPRGGWLGTGERLHRSARCEKGALYRILYRRSRNLIVLLHIFRKDRGKIAQEEIDLAKARWRDFKARMDA